MKQTPPIRERLLGTMFVLLCVAFAQTIADGQGDEQAQTGNTECTDGIDNDVDGRIDSTDVGCMSTHGATEDNDVWLGLQGITGEIVSGIFVLEVDVTNNELERTALDISMEISLPTGFSLWSGLGMCRMATDGRPNIVACDLEVGLGPGDSYQRRLSIAIAPETPCGMKMMDIRVWDHRASDRSFNDLQPPIMIPCPASSSSSSAPSSLPTASSTSSKAGFYCADTDPGMAPRTPGAVQLKPGTAYAYSDACLPLWQGIEAQNKLTEYSCGTDRLVVTAEQCAYLCRDGACIYPEDAQRFSGNVSIKRVWLTRSPSCVSTGNGVADDCVSFRLWVDALNRAGKKPAAVSDVEVVLHEWSTTHKKFLQSAVLGRYAYNGDASDVYYGTEYVFQRSALPQSKRFLVEARQLGNWQLLDTTISFDPSVEVAGTQAPSVAAGSSSSRVSIPSTATSASSPAPIAVAPVIIANPPASPIAITTSSTPSVQNVPTTTALPIDERTSPLPAAQVSARFTDVDGTSPVGTAAADLAHRGIIRGYDDGTFRPDALVNRAEAAKLFVIARFGSALAPGNASFVDTDQGAWYMPYVGTAAAYGIIRGNPDGTFKPGNQVNTAEFLKMLTLTFDLPEGLAHSYPDVAADAWFAPYAGIAQTYGLFPERGTSLEPGRAMTRGEVAYAIANILSR